MTMPFLENSTVKTRLRKAARSRKDLQVVYGREVRRLDAEVSLIQARCSHTLQKERTYPNESYTCEVCGYTSRFPIEADIDRAKEAQQTQSCPSGR